MIDYDSTVHRVDFLPSIEPYAMVRVLKWSSNLAKGSINEPNAPRKFGDALPQFFALLSSGPANLVSKAMFNAAGDETASSETELLAQFQRKASAEFGIQFESSSSKTSSLIGYTDSDLGEDLDNRKSVSGYVIMMNGCPVTRAASSKMYRIVVL